MPKSCNPPKCKCGCGELTEKYFDTKGRFKSYFKRKKGHGRGDIVDGKRKCTKCQQWIGIENFGYGRREKGDDKLVMFSYCKPCHSRVSTDNRDAYYGSARNYWLIKRYGINEEDFDLLVSFQGGKCAICQKRDAVMVDHCHETGQVRGILCSGCNSAIGTLGDNTKSVTRAIEYLKRSTGNVEMAMPTRTLKTERRVRNVA